MVFVELRSCFKLNLYFFIYLKKQSTGYTIVSVFFFTKNNIPASGCVGIIGEGTQGSSKYLYYHDNAVILLLN